ncbi:hypothetical protein AVEN_42108-1 [Araneus ventricosus]|uniref:Uncharacterized protein n=1 Tax=Araneus ventricosus TaxID=182803 RepID=A0A4Y2D5L8_ARAVE|nr:hypothetical protein AVEN_42108-1 [Araneus ventricosus]
MGRGAELASFFRYSVLPLLHRKASFGILMLPAHSGLVYQQTGGHLSLLICLIALNKTALAGNDAHLSDMLKMVSFSINTHLHMGLHFPLYIVQHGR